MQPDFHEADAKCRICQKPITLKIAADYHEHGDAMKLIPMATCNRCYDWRRGCRQCENSLYRSCSMLMALGDSDTKAANAYREKLRTILETVCRQYAKQFASLWSRTEYFWEDSFVSGLYEKPGLAGKLMSTYRMLARRHFITPVTTQH